jgi:hypothetical protein
MHNNTILALQTPQGWVEGPEGVREAVVVFFKNHFENGGWIRPTLDGLTFPRLSEENNVLLEAIFPLEEIEGVVKDSDGTKFPGSDGFNFAFIKEFWGLIK